MKKSELKQLIREELSKGLVNENSEKYMFFQNLETIKKEVEEMLRLDPQMVDAILANGHDWAADHISTSKDDIEEVHNFLMSNRAPMDELTKKQMKIAKAAPPEDKITGADFTALRKEKSSNLSESQQFQSLEQQAKNFVSKYGKVKIKI